MNTEAPLSIIMPCLNEARNIESAIVASLRQFDDRNIEGEIVVVDDGSTDDSPKIIARIAASDRRVRILTKDKTEGIGRAFWDGTEVANYPFVVMIPGDNENDPSEVFSFYHLVADVDIVIPFILNAEIRSISRRLISSIYRLIINISFGATLNYTNGLVIYNKEALKSVTLVSTGFFYQTELLIKLLRRGFLYAEVPQFLSKREGGKSKALSLKSFLDLSWSFICFVVDVQIRRLEGFTLHPSELPENTCTYKKYRVLIARSNSDE